MDVLDYYDQGALSTAFYDLLCQVDPSLSDDLEAYNALVPPGGSVLDLGCGTGRIGFGLAERAHKVVGIDCAPAMVARAQAKQSRLSSTIASRVSFRFGDMATVRLDRRFDLVVVAFFGLAHVPPTRWRRVFRTVRAHLKPEGLAAIHLPVAELMSAPVQIDAERPVLDIAYGAAGERLMLWLVQQAFDDRKFEQVLDYVVQDGAGREVRRSREHFVYFDEDPLPHAQAVGLELLNPPRRLGAGDLFTFRPTKRTRGNGPDAAVAGE